MPDPTNPSDLERVLSGTKVPDSVKKDTWDAFVQTQSPKEFEDKLLGMPFDNDTRKKIWDLKANMGVDPTAKYDLTAHLGTPKGVGPEPGLLHKAAHELPTVGGVVGGIVGGRFGMPIRGAVVGGMAGQRALAYIDALSGKKPLPGFTEGLEDVATAGVEQGAFEGAGGAVSKVARGVLHEVAGPTERALLKESQKFGLNLSSSEVLSGTKAGKAMGAFQHGGMRSVFGKTIADSYRKEGVSNASTFVQRALDSFGGSRTSTEIGTAAKGGLRLGKEGFRATTGKAYDEAVKAGPPVPMTDLKARAQRILQEEVLPLLEKFPAMQGKAGEAAAGKYSTQDLKQMLANARTPEQRQQIQVAMQGTLDDAIKVAGNTPVGKILKEILTADEEVSFDVATRYRERLMAAGKAPDELLGNRSKGTATLLGNMMRDQMAALNPEWAMASKAYGIDANLFKKKFIRSIALGDPEFVMNALSTKTGKINPTRVAALRTILMEKAPGTGKAADAAAGKTAWNGIRREWFARNVVGDNVATMADRMKKIDPDTLKAFFPDSQGATFIANAKTLGDALSKRMHEPNSRLYEILEISKIGGALGAGLLGVSKGGLMQGAEYAGATLATLEAVPALITWALYNPKMTEFLINGLTSKDPRIAASALFRVVGEFSKDHRLPDERTPLPPVPAGVSSGSVQ